MGAAVSKLLVLTRAALTAPASGYQLLFQRIGTAGIVGVGFTLVLAAVAYRRYAEQDEAEAENTSDLFQVSAEHRTASRDEAKTTNQNYGEAIKLLFKAPLMKRIAIEQYSRVAMACSAACTFDAGQIIAQEGDAADALYLVQSGEATFSATAGSEVLTLRRGDCFGMSAVRGDALFMATLTATSAVICLKIARSDLQALGLGEQLGIESGSKGDTGKAEAFTDGSHLKPLTSNAEARSTVSHALGKTPLSVDACESVLDYAKTPNIERADLKKVGLLGCGGFGAVELFEHLPTGETYAMKGISIGYTVKTGMQKSLLTEKLALALSAGSPFIIKLHTTYVGSQTVYFLLEAALGGELYATYNREKFHGKESHAQFYVASVASGLAHLHSRHIICRGIKPEDCVLDSGGRLKLVDMGLAKLGPCRTFTTCGTPDYFAPEVIASKGHGAGYDWWAVGILTFELMTGQPPFAASYPMQIYSKIMKGIEKIDFPQACTKKSACGMFVISLLKAVPEERLPLKNGGFGNLKAHSWFKSFDWIGLENETLAPPYLPVVEGPKDCSNFSARKEDMPKQIEFPPGGSREWLSEF